MCVSDPLHATHVILNFSISSNIVASAADIPITVNVPLSPSVDSSTIVSDIYLNVPNIGGSSIEAWFIFEIISSTLIKAFVFEFSKC